MRTRNDLSRSFCLPGASSTYHCALAPDASMKQHVVDAEHAIRAHLVLEIPERLAAHLSSDASVTRPKFRKQGSWAYNLLNDPLRTSVNYAEADSDLGVYLPVSTLKSCTNNPGFAADVYLDVVELALRSLADTKPNWTVMRRNCCIRVSVRFDAHVDVTCYVMPEIEFVAMNKAMFAEDVRATFDSADQELTWAQIPDRPLLATKSGWVPSDARAIHDFIENAAAHFGPAFKRVVRYVKGERDYRDDSTGPSSIGETLILARHMDERALVRDDLGVLAALGTIADGLLHKVPTPGNEGLDVLEKVSWEDRQRLAGDLRRAQASVRSAIYDMSWEGAHAALRTVLGTRFPLASDAPAEREDGTKAPTLWIPRATTLTAMAPAGNLRSA
jgi:hypothetical protein